ncbi:hypothetical protein AAAX96_15820 [Butyricimonas faecihominis]|uniref:hypothetical protein n=1 Tax=Butyricimonas faecihominis TaxID=1472416 RepID=UPI0032C0ACB6
MKRMIYLLTLGVVLGLAACEKVEIGYLEAENAGYSIDTLYLYNIEERLAEYLECKKTIDESGGPEIYTRLDEIKVRLAEIDEQFYGEDGLQVQLDAIYDAIDGGEFSGEELEQLQEEQERLENEWYDLQDEMSDLENERWDLNAELDVLAGQVGFNSMSEFTTGLAQLENRDKYNIPWVTAPLEGVLGTEPLSYSIARVRNENPESAELFRQALSIMGGGRIHVALDVKAPAGVYVVSIILENEGQHRLLEDIYTFIVEE